MGIAGGAERYRRYFQDVSIQGSRTAAQTSVQPAIAGKPKHTIFIQKIYIFVTTDAAQNITLISNGGTPRQLAFVPNSPGVGPQSFDFGDEGFALPEGDGLDLNLSAAGLAFDYIIVGYRKPTSTMTTAEAIA